MTTSSRFKDLFSEPLEIGQPFREVQHAEWHRLISRRRGQATAYRRRHFQPDLSDAAAYADSLAPYRDQFHEMLGWPLAPAIPPRDLPALEPTITEIGRDRLGTVSRVEIPVLPDMSLYGLLFLPHGDGPHPLVISQHGGGGTPELASWLNGTGNYNHMTHRVLEHGVACFAPQMLLWRPEFGPEHGRRDIDRHLQQLGSSVTAVELAKLSRGLDYLLARPDIDADRVGMIGLSYGGFYTLFFAAHDPRIRVAVSSCFFNSRYKYNWSDWVWKNSAYTMLDGEIASLVAPRALYIEVGRHDNLFRPGPAEREARLVAERYAAIDRADHFEFHVFDGGHELAWDPDPIPFLLKHLGV